jgi:hypothetical protein
MAPKQTVRIRFQSIHHPLTPTITIRCSASAVRRNIHVIIRRTVGHIYADLVRECPPKGAGCPSRGKPLDDKACKAAKLPRPLGENFWARTLIADDHALFREGLRLMLLRAYLKVVIDETANGSEALKRIEEHSDFDLVVADLEMPGLDGFDFLARLRFDG